MPRAMGAVIVGTASGRVSLAARSILGRSSAAVIRVVDARVSAEHACIFWHADAWHVRDLGSRNGTWLGEQRLREGERVLLPEGGSLFLGAPNGESVRLVDGAAPIARAVDTASGVCRWATHQLLQLPDEDNPTLAIFYDGKWRAETVQGGEVAVADQSVVEAGGVSWRLDLPARAVEDPVETTQAADGGAIELERCRLQFRVSRDEEHVELSVAGGARHEPLVPRTFHYMLLTLARRRLRDVAAGLPDAEQGWTYVDDLADMLGTTKPKLNLDVFRARQQLAAAGIEGASRIVERRTTTQQLRIGIAAVDIGAL